MHPGTWEERVSDALTQQVDTNTKCQDSTAQTAKFIVVEVPSQAICVQGGGIQCTWCGVWQPRDISTKACTASLARDAPLETKEPSSEFLTPRQCSFESEDLGDPELYSVTSAKDGDDLVNASGDAIALQLETLTPHCGQTECVDDEEPFEKGSAVLKAHSVKPDVEVNWDAAIFGGDLVGDLDDSDYFDGDGFANLVGAELIQHQQKNTEDGNVSMQSEGKAESVNWELFLQSQRAVHAQELEAAGQPVNSFSLGMHAGAKWRGMSADERAPFVEGNSCLFKS